MIPSYNDIRMRSDLSPALTWPGRRGLRGAVLPHPDKSITRCGSRSEYRASYYLRSSVAEVLYSQYVSFQSLVDTRIRYRYNQGAFIKRSPGVSHFSSGLFFFWGDFRNLLSLITGPEIIDRIFFYVSIKCLHQKNPLLEQAGVLLKLVASIVALHHIFSFIEQLSSDCPIIPNLFHFHFLKTGKISQAEQSSRTGARSGSRRISVFSSRRFLSGSLMSCPFSLPVFLL